MGRTFLAKRISVAAKREPADTVIKNGRIIDVFNGEIIFGDIAIVDGYFAGVGEYDGKLVIDAEERYVSPAFIDGHVHIESSMVTPAEFAKVLLLHGVTTAMADPHEIANVLGKDGIQFRLDASENLPFNFYFMLPSSVPATEFEHAGATLNACDLTPFYQHPRVLGLAEVMNFPAVLNADKDMLKKIAIADSLGKKIDGHGAGLSDNDINVYMAAGIRTDHECTTLEEARARLQKGMYLMIREGTVAKDLQQLIPIVNGRNARRCLFVTDDKHLDDLLEEGSIDHNVRMAIASGLSPITAIQMATINAAECFGLKNQGAIAPGYKADFLLLDDLKTLPIASVFKDGITVVENGQLVEPFAAAKITTKDVEINHLRKSVSFDHINEDHFRIQLAANTANTANVIETIPNSLLTKHVVEKVNSDSRGLFLPSVPDDLLKLAVIERHGRTKTIGLGIVKGLGLKSGAIASTVAHDSHNLIVAGTNDSDMILAADGIKQMQGGLVVANQGKVIGAMELSLAGLMTDRSYEQVYADLQKINQALETIGVKKDFNPFLTLSFLALPVIPELKLTDIGLFHFSQFKHIDINEPNL